MSENKLANLEARVESVQGQITSLTTKVEELPATINDNHTIIRADLHKLELAVNSCTSQISFDASSHSFHQGELYKKIGRLEEVVYGDRDKPSLVSRIQSLESSRKVVYSALGVIGTTIITMLLNWLSDHISLGKL